MRKLLTLFALFLVGLVSNTDQADIASEQSFGFGPNTAHADAPPDGG